MPELTCLPATSTNQIVPANVALLIGRLAVTRNMTHATTLITVVIKRLRTITTDMAKQPAVETKLRQRRSLRTILCLVILSAMQAVLQPRRLV